MSITLKWVLATMGTVPFWIVFVSIVIVGLNAIAFVHYAYPKIMGWLAHRRHLRNRALLRLSPHALKNLVREKERIIGRLEDQILQMRTELDRADEEERDMRDEIKRLSKRNVFMANEIRVDLDNDTQVLRPSRSARWG